MPPIVRAYAPSRYGQIHYRIVTPDGPTEAPPLLCLHQTPGNGVDWTPVLPTLGSKRVVIAADTPGYGMSDAPPEPAAIEDFAAIMLDLMAGLAEAGIVPEGLFDVMGFHTGSVIATDMASRAPDRVRRAVLFGLAAYPAEVREAKLANLLTHFPQPANDLSHVEKLWAIIQQLSDPRIGPEEKHVSMAECLRLGARMPWGYVSVYRYDFLGAMPRVQQPVLIFNPEDDLWALTHQVAHLFPNGERYDMPGVKHGVLSLEQGRVVAKIEGFLGAPVDAPVSG
ncbi:MAG: alpha/beta fold hydrolase [Sphingobium sp.]